MENNSNDVQEWLINFIGKNHDLSVVDHAQLISCNLFEEGYLDSMGIMNLVVEMEAAFGFSFTATDFQDRRFASIAGINEIVTEKTAA